MGRRGPKPRPKNENKESPTGIRLTSDLRSRLSDAANQNGVSLSEEMTARLEASFSEKRRRVDELGGLWTYSLFRLVAIALKQVKTETGHAWHENAYAFRHSVAAINEILGYFKPKGPGHVPADHPLLERLRSGGIKNLKPTIAQLEKFEHGRIAGMSTVFMMEVSDEHPGSAYHQQYGEIRDRLRPRLAKAGSKGKAQRDLLALDHNDPRWSVRG